MYKITSTAQIKQLRELKKKLGERTREIERLDKQTLKVLDQQTARWHQEMKELYPTKPRTPTDPYALSVCEAAKFALAAINIRDGRLLADVLMLADIDTINIEAFVIPTA